MSKTIISLKIEGPETQERFSAQAALQALSPNDQAAAIVDHLNYITDKAKRSLGFLTQEQIQQQQEQLQQLAETLVGSGRNEPAEAPEEEPAETPSAKSGAATFIAASRVRYILRNISNHLEPAKLYTAEEVAEKVRRALDEPPLAGESLPEQAETSPEEGTEK